MSKKFILGLKVKDSKCGEYLRIANCDNEKPMLTQEELNSFYELTNKELIISGIGKYKPTSDAQVWNVDFEHNEQLGKVVTDLWEKYDYFKCRKYGLPDVYIKLRVRSPLRQVRSKVEFSELFIKEISKTETILTL